MSKMKTQGAAVNEPAAKTEAKAERPKTPKAKKRSPVQIVSDPRLDAVEAVRSSPFDHVAVVARSASKEAARAAIELAEWLQRRSIEVALNEACLQASHLRGVTAFQNGFAYDLVVVLGGDGTLLSVARSLPPGVPILGVNMGRLGFLTELSRIELYPSMVQLLGGDFSIEERSLFDVELRRGDSTISRYRAFNDVVIAKSALAQIIELELQVNGRLIANYRSDGLIISTPNGSTAYNLSAGGPILYPALPVAVLTPICAHTLTFRPIVVPDSEAIEVKLQTLREEVFVTVDGQEGNSISYHDTVVVQRCETAVQMIRLKDRTFYDSLRDKLKWGG